MSYLIHPLKDRQTTGAVLRFSDGLKQVRSNGVLVNVCVDAGNRILRAPKLNKKQRLRLRRAAGVSIDTSAA